MGETAEFLLRAGDLVNGTELARMALDRNPWYSAWLWNTFGDGLYAMERYGDAQNAYEAAARVNPADVAANFNLSFVHARSGRQRDALEALAKALIHDFTGEYRERIIEQQQAIMRSLSVRWQMQQIRHYQRAAAFE
jgi:tetratricopeptide (TPR) repeat protein